MGRNVTDLGYKKETKKELKKHAATIHCSNTLSLLQRKITNALLYHAYNELMLKDEHEITIKQLCRMIGYQGNNHAAIKEALKELIATIIEWNVINDETGTENWTASSIIASVSLEGPLCYYAYSPRMKQLLHSPSMFGKIDLVIQSRFRSTYGLALYENCIRYRGLPHTKWFDISLFKKLMGVTASKYDVFRDFKRRVLDKAVDEVNTYSDLILIPELVKEGRRVKKLRFKLKERAKRTRLGNQKNKQRVEKVGFNTLKESIAGEFGLSAEQQEELFSAYDSVFIQEKAEMIKASKPYEEGKIQNLAAYLISAIKHNYQSPKAQTVSIHASENPLFEEKALMRQIEDIRAQYQRYREKTIEASIATLTFEEKEAFLRRFYRYAERTIQTVLKLQRNKYTKENVHMAPQVKAEWRRFALRDLDFLSILSLEEYVAELPEVLREAWQKLKSFNPDHALMHFSEGDWHHAD